MQRRGHTRTSFNKGTDHPRPQPQRVDASRDSIQGVGVVTAEAEPADRFAREKLLLIFGSLKFI